MTDALWLLWDKEWVRRKSGAPVFCIKKTTGNAGGSKKR